MGIFKRVDSELPNSVQNAFIEKVSIEDKFAALKKGAEKRQLFLEKKAQEEIIPERSWSEGKSPALFEDAAYSVSSNDGVSYKQNDYAVKRSQSSYDSEDRYTDIHSNFKTFSKDDYLSALKLGTSIWNPDIEEIKDAFMQSQHQQDRVEMMNKRTMAANKQNAHRDWEAEKSAGLRQSKVVSARGHEILRTAADFTAGNEFGMPNYEKLDSEHQERLRIAEASRDRRLSIKLQKSDYDIEQDWSDSEYHRAKTYNDIYERIPLILTDLED